MSPIIECDEKIILTQRAFEPKKGLLAVPGGFVNYEESLEDASKEMTLHNVAAHDDIDAFLLIEASEVEYEKLTF